MANATSAQIRAFVLKFAGANGSGFTSPGSNATAAIDPTLASLADFDDFVVRLSKAMEGDGVVFLAVPQELKNCVTWDDLVTQIALNQSA